MDGYVGEIKMFAGTFAPVNWIFCWGQLLQVDQYSTLYALIGTQFGGDGINTFGVPDLRGRVPVGAGTGPGLTPRAPGQSSGTENVTLSTAQMPRHSHTVKCDIASTGDQLKNTPQNNLPATISVGNGYGADETGNPLMKTDMLSESGSGQPHNNMPPWGCLQYIMCTEGLWPPRD